MSIEHYSHQLTQLSMQRDYLVLKINNNYYLLDDFFNIPSSRVKNEYDDEYGPQPSAVFAAIVTLMFS